MEKKCSLNNEKLPQLKRKQVAANRERERRERKRRRSPRAVRTL
jgi:hypothetical protein